MNFSLTGILELTKLTVRDPRMAALMVKSANLPLQVSVMMIVLAGVVSGVVSGLVDFITGPAPMVFELEDGQSMSFDLSPMAEGFYAVLIGLVFAWLLHRIGRMFGGQGSLPDIMAVTAILQLVMTVILIVQLVVSLAVPLLGLILVMLGLYVFLRGLGHAVNVGHDFDSLGRSTLVIVIAFLASVFVASFLVAILGFGPQGTMQGAAV